MTNLRKFRVGRHFARRLVIMVKEPVAGRVKTRLARGIGIVAATSAYRTMQTCVAARLSCDARWQTVFAISPDRALASCMPAWRGPRVAQGGGNLGDRLQRIFADSPRGPVIVVGTDIPGITPADIAGAFAALGTHDSVFGPSRDGGYWLIGLKRRPHIARPFAGVRWSSAHALADTLANISHLSVARLRHLDDIDTVADIAGQHHIIGRRILSPVTACR